MALSATLLFYAQYTKSGAGVTGKSGSITFTIKKLVRGSTPTITTVSTGGGVTVGSVTEVDATNVKGTYVVGVSGLDPAADYIAGAVYTGTASDVDLVDVPALWSEFSPAVAGGAVAQAVAGAAGGGLIAGSNAATSFASLVVSAGTLALASAALGAMSVTSFSNSGTANTAGLTTLAGFSTGAMTVTNLVTSGGTLNLGSVTWTNVVFTNFTVGAGTLTLNGGIIANITGGLSGTTGTASNVLLLNGSEPGHALSLVWDVGLSGHLTAGTTGKALKDASTGGTGGGPFGPGSDNCTLTFTSNGSPIRNAQTWITGSTVPTDVIAGTISTNDDGEVTYLLDAGSTYWVWLIKAGEEPIRGEPFVAVADP